MRNASNRRLGLLSILLGFVSLALLAVAVWGLPVGRMALAARPMTRRASACKRRISWTDAAKIKLDR